MWLSTSTSTRSIVPTKPTCSALATGATSNSEPSSPERPTAGWPCAVEPLHDVGVELAEQDHPRHLDRLRVGDPQALVEADLEPEPLHVLGDLGAAAVDDDRVEADVLEQDDVGGEVLAQALLAHRRAAVLDHDGAAVELPDVGERLEQGVDVGAHGSSLLRSCTRR